MRRRFFVLILFLSIHVSHGVSAVHCETTYVYNDAGVGPESLKQVLHTLQELLPPSCPVRTLDAAAVQAGDWVKDASLLIMPGGADLPYARALNGAGNAVIRRYVENGGAYLGFCAGAYYGASYVEFDRGGRWEVLGPRELSFFPGKAIGPALAPYDYFSNRGARVAFLHMGHDGANELPAYVNGGGYFEDAVQFSDVTVLGWYPGLEPRAAIVKIKVGRGVAILSGAHIEYDPALLNRRDPYLAPLIPVLTQTNAERVKWLKTILML